MVINFVDFCHDSAKSMQASFGSHCSKNSQCSMFNKIEMYYGTESIYRQDSPDTPIA